MARRLKGLAAAVSLAAIVAGLPLLLIATHNMGAPRLGWTPAGLWNMLVSPDDGTLFVTGLKVAGWVSWGILSFAIGLDLSSRSRHVPVPQIRGLALPQNIARTLVMATIAGFLVTTSLAIVPALGAPATAPAHTTSAPDSPQKPSPDRPTKKHRGAENYETVTVRKGDTLSGIALRKMGDGHAYPKIFEASKDIVQDGGRTITDPDLIWPGDIVRVPTSKAGDKPANSKPAKKPAAAGDATPSAKPTAPTPTATASATPAAATPTTEQPAPAQTDDQFDSETDEHAPAWQLTGFAGAGALLAGSMWLLLRRRRRAQLRARRPGRMIATPPAVLAPVEKTLSHCGGPTAELIANADEALRRLANFAAERGTPAPSLAGVDLTPDALRLRLLTPVQLPPPWQATDDPCQWTIATGDITEIGPFDEDSPPPWPQLATIGMDDAGSWRLLNLETLGVVSLTGPSAFAIDLARYIVAELAVAPWARDLQIDCVGVCNELIRLNPARLRYLEPTDPINASLAAAVDTVDRLDSSGIERVDAARVDDSFDDLWESRILIADSHRRPADLDVLTDLIVQRPGGTATTVVLIGADEAPTGVEIKLDSAGRVLVPSLDLDIVVTGITHDEARGSVDVLVAGDTLDDTEMPVEEDPAEPWQALCNDAGQLRDTFTVPRVDEAGESTTTLLSASDDRYLEVTANTVEDLATLAPLIPAAVRQLAEDTDPTLDGDLQQWRAESCDRPRLTVLGPMRLRVGRTGDPAKVARRLPYYTEFIAYLASRSGATTQEVATALGIAELRVRKDASVARAWLGTNLRTGEPFLPEATRSAEAVRRGVGLYLVEDLLVDAHLFRRLRLRAEARGSEGLPDLLAALQLVTGTPYDGLLSGGRPWLTDTRPDQTLLCAIVDVAHLVTTVTLEAGNTRQARAAAELAMLVAPDESTPALDLAAVAAREGRHDEAVALARSVVDWRDGSGDAPVEVPSRAERILRAHRWLEPKTRAS
ncbi:MAG: LysM peptidoglycan-binding domain-containing protein [Actinobacteria bacterium]|nr:LysM peptidoglycan-binding domain-containing protein [Actinomycetota bacterium]